MNYSPKRASLFALCFLSVSCILNGTNYAIAEIEPKLSEASIKLTQIPSTSDAPGVPSTPSVPGTPTVPATPTAPTIPSTPGVPSVPSTPSVPGTSGVPSIPGTPSVPGVPSTPGVPSIPSTPSVPGVPGSTGVPSVPGTPNVPGIPSTPSAPSVPEIPTPQIPTSPGTSIDLESRKNLPSLGQITTQGGVFNTLLAALEAADISDILEGEGPLTLFAPIDSAFEQLPDGVLNALLEPQNQDLLLDVLANHVLDTQVVSSDLSNGPVKTMGGEIIVDTQSSDVRVNDARVLRADVQGRNGVIHVIDQVLVPETVVQALSDRSSTSSSSSSSSSTTSSSSSSSSTTSSSSEAVVVPTRPTSPSPAASTAPRPAPPVRGLW